MTSAMDQSCVINLIKGKVDSAREATKHVQQVYGVEVSDVTVCHAFY